MITSAIVIPTHNRPFFLARAIQSIYSIFDSIDVDIIIGDNSCIKYQKENRYIASQYKCQYLDLSLHEANLPYIYQCMLQSTAADYVLPLDDDDVLVNKKLHRLAHKVIIQKKCLVSFNTKQIEDNISLLHSRDLVEINDINMLPLFWNGHFQTGAMYYNRIDLLNAIRQWQTPSNIFDLSHDECWAMLCMNLCKKCVHIPFVGLKVQRELSGSILKEMALFSSRNYIDRMSDMLNLANQTRQQWKDIQLRELKEICQSENLKYSDVFENKKLTYVDDFISKSNKDGNCYDLKQTVMQMLKDIYDI